MLLTGSRIEVSADPAEFAALAADKGWGDGLPMVPPTPERVAEYVRAAGRDPADVVAQVPPRGADATVEALAVQAVLAGAPAAAMSLIAAAVGAVTERDFGLNAIQVTTAPVVPAFVVNGPARHSLRISYGAGCLGGADGSNASIGRALRLALRNIGGQRIGMTSQSVFGQPARTAGILFGEWEEQSPWPPLGERRDVLGDAVTAFSANGSMNIVDNASKDADLLVDRISRSLAYPGSNGYRPHTEFCTILVGINPIWAALLGKRFPDVKELQQRLWDQAALPLASWPDEHQVQLEDAGMVAGDGRVHVIKDPSRLLVVVCGGRGGHHALALHGFSSCVPVTRGF
jgi:hypothetical protein